MVGIIISALIVIAMAVQAAMCPLGSESVCTPITASSAIFGFLGLVCLGGSIALYLDQKVGKRSGDASEEAQSDG